MTIISGVVPTNNNEATIRKCLESLVLNNIEEIVISDGGSHDQTLQIAKKFPQVMIVNAGKGVSEGRDVGWRNTKGELILFLDADAYIPPDTVEKLRFHLATSEVAGVSCVVYCANRSKLLPRLRDFDFKLSYSEMFNESGVASCVSDPFMCGLYRRTALEAVNGFDLYYQYAEDNKLLQKLRSKNYLALIANDAVVFHHHRESLRGLCQQFYHHGLGRRLLIDESREFFYKRKHIRRFICTFLENAPKAGLLALFCYPTYRLITETAFCVGYIAGRKQVELQRK